MKIETYPIKDDNELVEKIIHVKVTGTQREINELSSDLKESADSWDTETSGIQDLLDVIRKQID